MNERWKLIDEIYHNSGPGIREWKAMTREDAAVILMNRVGGNRPDDRGFFIFDASYADVIAATELGAAELRRLNKLELEIKEEIAYHEKCIADDPGQLVERSQIIGRLKRFLDALNGDIRPEGEKLSNDPYVDHFLKSKVPMG